jgi:MFS family permease
MRPNGPLLLVAATVAALWLITLGFITAGIDAEGGAAIATGVALFVFGGLLNPLLGPLADRSPIASRQRQPLLLALTGVAVVFLLATALAPAVVPYLWAFVLAPVAFGVATWTEADDRKRRAEVASRAAAAPQQPRQRKR